MSSGHMRVRQPGVGSGALRGSRLRADRTTLRQLRVGDRDARIFGACTLVLAVYLVVDAPIGPSTGNDLARRPLWLGALLLPALGLLFVRGARTLRTLLATVVGLGATTIGLSTSVAHAILTGASASDYLGVLATLAALVLLGLAFRIGLRGRRPALQVAVGLLWVFILIQWGIAPAIDAGIVTNAPRPAIADARTLGVPRARDVTFASAGGVRLSGWYVPPRNHAAVILLHGSHGTRNDTVGQLRMLIAAGYGVLAYDARGHGRSGGQANALGWHGVADIAAAIGFLQREPGIDPQRIAAVGLSMGAEESLRAAASRLPLAAVVADGAGASTLGDDRLVSRALAPLYLSVTWETMRAIELASGDHEPAPLKSILDRVNVPVLLIASNASNEATIDRLYATRIGRTAALWSVPDAGHTEALRKHPREYAARVLPFLRAALQTPR